MSDDIDTSLVRMFLNESYEESENVVDNYTHFNMSQGYSDYSSSYELPYFGEHLEIYRNSYGAVHGYISFAVCVFGIMSNILNIIVLTRKNMQSPTNAILTGLAVADMMVMFSYLPFTFHNYIRADIAEKDRFSYSWAVFTLFHAHFTVVNHTISIWLTVTVAVWRFMAVCFPTNTVNWCGMPRAKCAILSTYICCSLICIPEYLTFSVSEFTKNGELMYRVGFSEIAQRHDNLLQKVNFWFFSVVTKLVPCLALTVLSLGLIRVLYETNLRRQRLKNRAKVDTTPDRTTRMLLAVLLLFLITEFPSGLLALLSGILGSEFFNNVYLNFGETMDALALINSAINFIIYCTMSRQFRDTFTLLFIPKLMVRARTAPRPLPKEQNTYIIPTPAV